MCVRTIKLVCVNGFCRWQKLVFVGLLIHLETCLPLPEIGVICMSHKLESSAQPTKSVVKGDGRLKRNKSVKLCRCRSHQLCTRTTSDAVSPPRVQVLERQRRRKGWREKGRNSRVLVRRTRTMDGPPTGGRAARRPRSDLARPARPRMFLARPVRPRPRPVRSGTGRLVVCSGC